MDRQIQLGREVQKAVTQEVRSREIHPGGVVLVFFT